MERQKYYERALFLNDDFDKVIQLSQKFYELTYSRDQAIYDNLIQVMNSKDQQTAALVVGGFHSDNLKNLFKSKGISFVSLSPQVTHETNHDQYEGLLLQESPKDFFNTADENTSNNSASMMQVPRMSTQRELVASLMGSDSGLGSSQFNERKSNLNVSQILRNERQEFNSAVRMSESPSTHTIEEIDLMMKDKGFYELRVLWDVFNRSKKGLDEINDSELIDLRKKHMGGIISHPIVLALALSVTTSLAYSYFYNSFPPVGSSFVKLVSHAFIGVNALLSSYAALFFAVIFQRVVIQPWKSISALDLASMLRQRNYGEWFNKTDAATRVMAELKLMGVNGQWDNSNYRAYYKSGGAKTDFQVESPSEFVQNTLRSVLGYKEGKRFVPGRFVDSLTEKKKSVTAFVKKRQVDINKNKLGELSTKEGLDLLSDLLDNFLLSESPGYEHVKNRINSIKRGSFLPDGVIEVKVWGRDPWVDLTNQKDFFSSASLRGGKMNDSLQRRTKGLLAPFNYMRNKSITALDLSTKDGRSVRVRAAASIYREASGRERSIFYIDGVEGRFDIKPRLIKKAIEDYAKTAGFDAVLYYKHPLNKVPERFVKHIENTGASLEELNIRYVDSTTREYLDAFGRPFEPFEYAFPKGKVLGYIVELGEEIIRDNTIPTPLRLFWIKAQKKYTLLAIALLSSISLGWVIWKTEPALILPLGLATAAVLIYDSFFQRRSLGSRMTQDASLDQVPFIDQIRSKVKANKIANQMNYGPRFEKKVVKLLQYFPQPNPNLRYFFEEVLYNVSIKDTDLINVLKFLDQLKQEKRTTAVGVFAAMWTEQKVDLEQSVMTIDKVGRDESKKELFASIDVVKKFIKATTLAHNDVSKIIRMQRRLKIDIHKVLEIVTISPKILKGLEKPPRPIYAWIAPTILASGISYALLLAFPSVPIWALYGVTMSIVTIGTYYVSTQLNIAPGILYYEKTRRYLSQIIDGKRGKSNIQDKMEKLGIDVHEFDKEKIYENKADGVRIVKRNKKTLEGAIKFITSSEEIGCCIALQNFVSWALPSLLDDDSIMLADIYYKGAKNRYNHRGQMWMVAAEENGIPVLTVNSFEFNNEGAKYINELMPETIKSLQDMARRAGFKKIYIGISDFGRGYLDAHYPQGSNTSVAKKIHHSDAGYRYYFDTYRHKWAIRNKSIVREYVYEKKRGMIKRIYAVIFGAIEYFKGNKAKAKSFIDTATSVNNYWEIPLNEDSPVFEIVPRMAFQEPEFGDEEYWFGKMGLSVDELVNLGLIQRQYEFGVARDFWQLDNAFKRFAHAPQAVNKRLVQKVLTPYRNHERINNEQGRVNELVSVMREQYGADAGKKVLEISKLIGVYASNYSAGDSSSFAQAIKILRNKHYPKGKWRTALYRQMDDFPETTRVLLHLAVMIAVQGALLELLPKTSDGIVGEWRADIGRFLARSDIREFTKRDEFMTLALQIHNQGIPQNVANEYEPADIPPSLSELLDHEQFKELVEIHQDIWQLNIATENESARGKKPETATRPSRPTSTKHAFLKQFPDGRMKSILSELDYYARVSDMLLEDEFIFPDIEQEIGTIELSEFSNPHLIGAQIGRQNKLANITPAVRRLLGLPVESDEKSEAVVQPVTINLGGDQSALLLSGPNMGGKTTTARSIGLAVMMTQMGLPLPATEAKLALFKNVYTLFPQPEQLQAGYGYFGALVRQLITITERAGPGDLVILDEVPVGTDYYELVAVASVLLEDLIKTGATVVATGHLKKAFEIVSERTGQTPYRHLVDKSGEQVRPNFDLEPGIAEHSYAIELMQQAGFTPELQDLARKYYGVITRGEDPDEIPAEISLRAVAPSAGLTPQESRDVIAGAMAGIGGGLGGMFSGASSRREDEDADVESIKSVVKAMYPQEHFALPSLIPMKPPEAYSEIEKEILDVAKGASGVIPEAELQTRHKLIGGFVNQGEDYNHGLKNELIRLATATHQRATFSYGGREQNISDFFSEQRVKLDVVDNFVKIFPEKLEVLNELPEISEVIQVLKRQIAEIDRMRGEYIRDDYSAIDDEGKFRASWSAEWQTLVQTVTRASITIDKYSGIALSVIKYDLKAPTFTGESNTFSLQNSKPLFPDRYATSPFIYEAIAQSFAINPDKPVMVLTGPNSSGKTVLMFNSYANSILALSGNYVSGDLVSSRFRRIHRFFGGHDDISQGESYFLNILRRYGTILNEVGAGDLVILDELHGTDNFELAAIQLAVLHYLRSTGATVIFNTHVRDGIKELDQKIGLDVWQTDVDFNEAENDVDPKFTVSPDPNLEAKSHGLAVAKAWLSPDQYERATEIHRQLMNQPTRMAPSPEPISIFIKKRRQLNEMRRKAESLRRQIDDPKRQGDDEVLRDELEEKEYRLEDLGYVESSMVDTSSNERVRVRNPKDIWREQKAARSEYMEAFEAVSDAVDSGDVGLIKEATERLGFLGDQKDRLGFEPGLIMMDFPEMLTAMGAARYKLYRFAQIAVAERVGKRFAIELDEGEQSFDFQIQDFTGDRDVDFKILWDQDNQILRLFDDIAHVSSTLPFGSEDYAHEGEPIRFEIEQGTGTFIVQLHEAAYDDIVRGYGSHFLTGEVDEFSWRIEKLEQGKSDRYQLVFQKAIAENIGVGTEATSLVPLSQIIQTNSQGQVIDANFPWANAWTIRTDIKNQRANFEVVDKRFTLETDRGEESYYAMRVQDNLSETKIDFSIRWEDSNNTIYLVNELTLEQREINIGDEQSLVTLEYIPKTDILIFKLHPQAYAEFNEFLGEELLSGQTNVVSWLIESDEQDSDSTSEQSARLASNAISLEDAHAQISLINEAKVFIAEVDRSIGIEDEARIALDDLILEFKRDADSEDSLLVYGLIDGQPVRINARQILLDDRGKSKATLKLTDIKMMLDIADSNRLPVFKDSAQPAVIVLHVNSLTPNDSIEQAEVIERITREIDGLGSNISIILEGSDANQQLWLEHTSIANRIHNQTIEDMPYVHVLGENDSDIELRGVEKNHRWVVLSNKSKSDQTPIFAYGSIMSYVNGIAQLNEEALNNPVGTNIELAYRFYKSITQHKKITLQEFVSIITDPRQAREYPIDPVVRVDIETALRLYDLMTKQTAQSA